ncbi:IclR family transcriptional regulator [Kitasatospora sp. NPDC058965]|uniref:IclR family transcriptional regulator n=1 Tax=Kitasatospora sp. NPDC058965 TaxID=3346682 RepID=UPI0036AC80AF
MAVRDSAGSGREGEEPTLVKSAERTVRIVEALAASPTRLTLTELQEVLGYPRSSLHALVRTLRELKWVESDEAGLAFGVGPHALLSGTAYLDRDPALRVAVRTLEDLRDELGFTSHYARRDDGHVLYLATRESRQPVVAIQRVGRRLPVHITALGQALLADLTPAEVSTLLPPTLEAHTPRSLTDHAALAAELDQVRSRGWAFESQQGTEGVACVAAVVGYRIPATDAISCAMPADLATPERVRQVGQTVVAHAARLAVALRREGIR